VEVIIFFLIISAALLVIASGIWVAFALGNAIFYDDKKKMPPDLKKTQ